MIKIMDTPTMIHNNRTITVKERKVSFDPVFRLFSAIGTEAKNLSYLNWEWYCGTTGLNFVAVLAAAVIMVKSDAE